MIMVLRLSLHGSIIVLPAKPTVTERKSERKKLDLPGNQVSSQKEHGVKTQTNERATASPSFVPLPGHIPYITSAPGPINAARRAPISSHLVLIRCRFGLQEDNSSRVHPHPHMSCPHTHIPLDALEIT